MNEHAHPEALRAGDRPLAAVVRDILIDVQELLRAELRLARAEVRHEVGVLSSSGVVLAVGALGAASAWLFLLWTVAYALAGVMPMWAATLVVSAVTGVVGGGLLAAGIRRLKNVQTVPRRTVAALKENVEWIKQSSR